MDRDFHFPSALNYSVWDWTELKGNFKRQKEVGRNPIFLFNSDCGWLQFCPSSGLASETGWWGRKQRWWVYPDGRGIVDQSCKETPVTRLIQRRYNQHYFQGKDFDLYNHVSFFDHVYLRLQTPETLKPKGFRNALGSSHKFLLCLSPSLWNGA